MRRCGAIKNKIRDAWELWESLVRNMWQSPRDDFKDHLHGECRTKFLEDNVSKELKMFHLEKAQGITLRTTPREHRTKSLDDNASKELKMVFLCMVK
jgi:hypothetical protein